MRERERERERGGRETIRQLKRERLKRDRQKERGAEFKHNVKLLEKKNHVLIEIKCTIRCLT